MIANFYKNLSDKRYITKNITNIRNDIQIVLKDNTDMKNPVIIVSNFSNLKDCNYIYIQEFERYYYINNMEFSQQRVLLYCTCDVLMSFKDEILNLNCVIKRQENRKNLYLDDEKYKAYAYSRITTKPFPSGFNRQAFIIAVAGGE